LNEYTGSLPRSKPNSTTLVNLTVFRAGELTKMRTYQNIDDVKPVDLSEYKPEGGTPLQASIYKRIVALDKVLKTSPTPPAVLFVIMTDGEENVSHQDREFMTALNDWAKTGGADITASQSAFVKELVEARSKDGWTFVFLGANQDAFHEGAKLGVSTGNTVNYEVGATVGAMRSVGAASASYLHTNSLTRSTDKSIRYSTSETFAEAGIDNKKTIDK
jgi:hypothetical protein